MADLTRLQSTTDASENKYAPLSWLAVASAAVGGVFVITLLVLAVSAFWGGKALFVPHLLAIPLVGILLAFAARRAIRNSEGARAGTDYANAGWWVCLVSGLCFFAYLFAVDWSVRGDAQRQLVGWVEGMIAADPTNPDDPATKTAYVKLVAPANQESQEVTNPTMFKATHGAQLTVFRQCNLLLLAARNKDTAKIAPMGLESWEQQEGDLTCWVTGRLSCAEGDFPVRVQMKAVTATGARRWQVLPGELQFIPEDAAHKPICIGRTRYGWMVDRATDTAVASTYEFIAAQLNLQQSQPMLSPTTQYPYPYPLLGLGQGVSLDTFVSGRLSPDGAKAVLLSACGRHMVLGGGGLLWSGRTAPEEGFYAREDGKPLSADDRKLLASCLDPKNPVAERITPPGRRNPQMPVRNSLVTVADDRVTVKTAVELRPDAVEFQTNSQSYLVGRLVWVCDDPQAVKEFKEAKAGRGDLTATAPTDIAARKYPFRLTGLESNMNRFSPPPQRGGPGGPPGGPGM